jgi:SAM-dependent methyltransferase
VSGELKFAHFPYVGQVLETEVRRAGRRLSVLDVGCGPGDLAKHTHIPSQCDLYGLDLWQHQLSQAADLNVYRHLLQVNLIDGIPFKSESFDLIICSAILMYLPNASEIVADCHRLLRPGGRILVYNPTCSVASISTTLKKWCRKIYQEKATVALDCQTDWKNATRACRITYYTWRSLVKELTSPGFEVTAVKGFRISRNRIRVLNRLEKFGWFRRASVYLASKCPYLASDILVEAVKPRETEPGTRMLAREAA